MFDLGNHEMIMRLVDMRDDGDYVIPLYVQLYGKRYGILELDEITARFTRSVFKVGFAVANGLFVKDPFPRQLLVEFETVDAFLWHDDDSKDDTRVTVFESGNIPVLDHKSSQSTQVDLDEVRSQIREYYDMLYNHVYEHVDQHIKKLVSTDFDL